MFKKRGPIKAKRIENWQQEEHLQDSFIEIVKQLQHGGTDKQPISSTRNHYRVIGLDCLIILLQFNWLKSIELVM